LRIQLTVAGTFWRAEDQRKFEEMIQQKDLSPEGPASVVYAGFAGGEKKWRLFRESDCLVFPTYYSAESFGIVLVEGMAFGLALIASRWRGLQDLLPEGYPGSVDPKQPGQIADSIVAWLSRDYDSSIREHFLREYTADVFARKMKKALVETGG
jgi:glycosyltransferase involved in cell wall biosynthesis